jgi:hypothetical protein
MYIVQILIPLSDNNGASFAPGLLKSIQDELAARFGGLTAYSRAPAQGIWATDNLPALDDIVIVEVMVEELDNDWWHGFRSRTERLLRQEQLVVRALPIELL